MVIKKKLALLNCVKLLSHVISVRFLLQFKHLFPLRKDLYTNIESTAINRHNEECIHIIFFR